MSRASTRRFLRDNSLALVFGLLFIIALAGQAIGGHADSTVSKSPTVCHRSRWVDI